MNKQISPKITALTFGILAVVFLAAFYVVAWREPSQAPPGGNVAAPLNVGPAGQSKEGGLIINTGGAANGLIIDKGKLCLGADCRNTWPLEGGPITTYHISVAVSESQGEDCPGGPDDEGVCQPPSTIFSTRTKSFTCLNGSIPRIISRTTAIFNPSSGNACGYAIDLCPYSISGSTIYYSAKVVRSLVYYPSGGVCEFDRCDSYGGGCYYSQSGCEVQFQCGLEQWVGD
ncbi:MAG: hypothetical protein HYV47_02355 [Candidatus Nealsonbacteria bacterium]|nr:hypothetical protein [Candidatus Nealsonbacteria bacterium]